MRGGIRKMAKQKSKKAIPPKSIMEIRPEDQGGELFEDFLQELAMSLNRKAFVHLSVKIVTNIKATLRNFRQSREKVPFNVAKRIVDLVDSFSDACSLLHPNAVVAIVRILIYVEKSHFRDRGLYLLASFIHDENKKLEAKNEIQRALSDVGKDCLELIFVSFCDKNEAYETRRWTGLLVLELISHSDDNMQLVGLMPEDKRRQLGSQILYEENEILRTISGRILTTLIGSNIPKEFFFPNSTETDLIATYPEKTISASQWDKNFSNYLDSIWDKIAGIENQGSIEFAQNITSTPEYLDTKNISVYHRSIYVVVADCVYIYVHSGDKGFDAAIDIPYHLISDIGVEPTPLDRAVKVEPPADLILQIKCVEEDQTYVNSTLSELSTVRLTFRDTTSAEGIAKVLQAYRSKLHYKNGGIEVLSVDQNQSEPNSQISVESKVSQSGKGLVLDGNYRSINSQTAKARADSDTLLKEQDTIATFTQPFHDVSTAIGKASTSEILVNQSNLSTVKISDGVEDDVECLYYASPVARTRFPKPQQVTETNKQADSSGKGEMITLSPLTSSPMDPMSLQKLPRGKHAPVEDENLSKLTLDASDGPEISDSPVFRRQLTTFAGNSVDNTLKPLQHDTSIDELSRMPPKKKLQAPPKKKRALKSKKPLNLSKLASAIGNELGQQQVEVGKHQGVLTKSDGIDEIQCLEDINASTKIKVECNVKKNKKRKSTKSTKAVRTRKSGARGLKPSIEVGDGEAKGKLSAMTRLNTTEVREIENEMSGRKYDEDDVQLDLANCSNKSPLETPPSPHGGHREGNAVIGTADTTENHTFQKKHLQQSNKALRLQKAVRNNKVKAFADIGQQDVDSDTKHLQQHESLFEVEFQDHDLVNVNDGQLSNPALPLCAATRIAGKMEKMFEFLGETNEPKRKLKMYGKDAQIACNTVPVQSKPKSKTKESPKLQESSPAASLPVRSKGKGGPITKGKTKNTPREITETISISSGEENDLSADIERYQLGRTSKVAKKKVDGTIAETELPFRVLGASSDFRRLEVQEGSTNGHLNETLHVPNITLPSVNQVASKLPPKKQPTPTGKKSSARVAVSPKHLQIPIDAPKLVNEHLARKTPIVAFDRDGPRSHGLSSMLNPKPTKILSIDMDNSRPIITGALNLRTKKRLLEFSSDFEASTPKKARKFEITPSKVMDNNDFDVDISGTTPRGLKSSSPVVSLQDSLLSRSKSRVTENGSPRAKATIANEPIKLANLKHEIISLPTKVRNTNGSDASTVEKRSFDLAVDRSRPFFDDSLITHHFSGLSSNSKLEDPARGRQDTMKPHHSPLKSPTTGDHINAATEKGHEPTHALADPFKETKTSKLCDFAKYLKGEKTVGNIVGPDAKNLPRLRFAKDPAQSRPRQFEPEMSDSDPEKTLVDVENQNRWDQAKPLCEGSNANSDYSSDGLSVVGSEVEEITPSSVWRRALKPHQKNLTDTLNCMVQVLVGELIDKETALDDIVDDYLRNGTKLVQDIEDKTSADRRELESQVTITLQHITQKFQKFRDAANALKRSDQPTLSEFEEVWRKRQHQLQGLLKEKIRRK